MNLDQIETKCFILALFIRDDGNRFLLGSRAYEFLNSQLHFAANTYQNDIVEVQGNDGIMLAGQVRRATAQAFDGYIGDSSVNRTTIEQYRKDFMQFFRKNHYYKVVYVFPDGSAIQRRNGFIVEAPEVKELYQLFPQYHISMNFEDINYYEYSEGPDGQEVYGESVDLKIATSANGGLIWADNEQTTSTGEGTDFTIKNTISGETLSSVQLKGDTTQQTYSGKNLYDFTDTQSVSTGASADSDGWITITYDNSGGSSTSYINYWTKPISQLVANTQYDIFLEVKSVTGNAKLNLVDNASASQFKEDCISQFADLSNNTTYKFSSTTKSNISSSTISIRTYGQYAAGTSGTITFRVTVTQHSSTTAAEFVYEPYVGGIPAPNPDYPQTVNTVTGRQVVTISDGDSQSQSYEVNLGKNLLDMDATENGGINPNGDNAAADDNWRTIGYIEAQPNATYTYSMNGNITGSFYFLRFYQYDKNHNFISPRVESGSPSLTVTTNSNTRYIRLSFYSNVETMTESMARDAKLQLELGSATTYAPYFTPIELCKIGDYQDYIYQSGSDWYLHKEIDSAELNGTPTWSLLNSKTNYNLFETSDFATIAPAQTQDIGGVLANRFIVYTNTALWADDNNSGICISTTGTLRINILKTLAAGINSMRTWCGNNPTAIYYAIATPTDTQITNAALVAQLNALASATTYDGQTIFTVVSDNKLAILKVTVLANIDGGIVWDEYGATWEEGAGGGPTIITIDSIDNVYPVWELTGPAVNPQLSVLSTNTTLSYSGTITASQTLRIDMFNKTATLNGASVIGNVSGDWVYLAPGTNRITYTANNADATSSKLWWQEIVG